MTDIISTEMLVNKIYFIRGAKIMLDSDLAELYGVETRVLNQAVKRNVKRFPEDFMFQLQKQEFDFLISQSVTSKKTRRGDVRKMPLAFTEQGVAMLSGILNSERAINVNIEIMRTFTKMRNMISISDELKREIGDLREQTDERFQIVFEALDRLLQVESEPKKKIDFTVKEKVENYG